MKPTRLYLTYAWACLGLAASIAPASPLEKDFATPPDSARPGVYWYFMDGNLDGREMLKDLESMKDVGIGNLIFLEVDAGVPRGPVKFMSDEWQGLFASTVHHAERLGIDITLGAGPGWCGSGGPWVKAEQSMQHLVFSSVDTRGPAKFDGVLPMPAQRIDAYHNMGSPFYQDVVVFAFPKCAPVIADIAEKALYERNPYSSAPGVKPWLPAPAHFPNADKTNVIDPRGMIDLTNKVQPDGRLAWDVPPGEWTILRMGRRSTGANTRPAPAAGTGLEHDKFDPAALDDHYANYCGKLLSKVGTRARQHGWTAMHLDSWEMGAQNWTPKFREEFKRRRGYDPLPFFPAFSGRAVVSIATSERFLWDMRLTAQELVLENYAGHLKELGRKQGLELSIEPYDMNPTADLDLGAVADVPMCEFWSAGMGYETSFSCIEASSIAHTTGRPVVAAESFTALPGESWQQYPWSMKNQGDWAFCMGVNRFVYHTFVHQAPGDEYRPGMTMGGIGVHWDRGQTWWPLAGDYHRYVTRCSHLLRQGVTVSDILYLTPEGAPQVFRPPTDALNGSDPLADKKGHGFDGCSPNILMARAAVKDGCIEFPGGSSYRLMVLPRMATMTPALLEKITRLVEAGAVVYGAPPIASPGLSGYPQCDTKVREMAENLWGGTPAPVRQFGKGRVITDPGADFSKPKDADQPLLPDVGNWIWLNEGNPVVSAPVGDVQFRFAFDVPDIKAVTKARLEATADNSFTIKLNGTQVLAGDNFHNIQAADVLSTLRTGTNTITVVATNTSAEANPAAFVAALRLGKADGSNELICSDQRWSASRDGITWSAAKPLGPAGMEPWLLNRPSGPIPDLYPSYATTTAVLDEMQLPQDFQADGPVRHAHRQTAGRDIYFISNTTDKKVTSNCIFRVDQGAPELWDPVTGEVRNLPQFTRQGLTTSVPISLEPYQSFFVMFARSKQAAALADTMGVNFPVLAPVATLDGPWEVSFDPKWGGPEKTTFDTLRDWTTSEERGIKYYSGIATYRKTFDLPKEAGKQIYLDLGIVHDMARVRLNGRNLGVVWCAPWRVDLTGSVKDEGNTLEIEVANRWANRMLGDQQPPDKDVRSAKWPSGLLGGQEYKTGRYTFATAGGLGRLLPSGLLGPVRIMVQSPH